MDTLGIKELLYRNYEHPRWGNVAASCCGKSTMVCPTCLCTTVEDVANEKGDCGALADVDSCFTVDFSYVDGLAICATPKSCARGQPCASLVHSATRVNSLV